MDMTDIPLLNEPAAKTTARFLTFLQRHNLGYGITWKSVGRVRHGVLEVYHNDLGPCEGNVIEVGAVTCRRCLKGLGPALPPKSAEVPLLAKCTLEEYPF